MKKQCAIALLIFLCTGCSAPSSKISEANTTTVHPTESTETGFAKATPGEQPTEDETDNFPLFTKKQLRQDFETLLKVMDENYPHFETAAQMYGTNRNAVTAQYQNAIENAPDTIDMKESGEIILNYMTSFGGTGHFNLVEPSLYNSLSNSAEDMKDQNPDAMAQYQILTDKKVVRTYTYIMEHNPGFNLNPWPQKIEKKAVPEVPTEVTDGIKINDNLSYKIIDDQTVYLNINSFFYEHLDEDRKALDAFYQQIKEYKNLIIDVTKNNGGSDQYWMENIVAPNITTSSTYQNYALAKSTGIYQKEANDPLHNRTSEAYQYISKLPQIGKDTLAAFDLAFENSYTVEPRGITKAFEGKVYLLVGENVYSAGEGFARFCKGTGFATLVGTNTGGEGGYLAIKEFVLPNTGFVVRFSTLYVLNEDGSGNTLYGTKPDVIASGESALDACLALISKE